MDEQILCLYAKGLLTRDFVEACLEMDGAEVSAGLVSQVTNAVIEQVREWQMRPLDEVCPNLKKQQLHNLLYRLFNSFEKVSFIISLTTIEPGFLPLQKSAFIVMGKMSLLTKKGF